MTRIKVQFTILKWFLWIFPIEAGTGSITITRQLNTMRELTEQLEEIKQEAQEIVGKNIRITKITVEKKMTEQV